MMMSIQYDYDHESEFENDTEPAEVGNNVGSDQGFRSRAYFTHLKCQKRIGDDVGFFL
jgi:hypothetical protein